MLDLRKSIVARLEAADASTFRGGNVYTHRAPSNLAPAVGQLPIVVVGGFFAEPNDSFESDGINLTFLVSIIDHADNFDTQIDAAYTRVYGDGDPPNTPPTYGLHRHIPVLVDSVNQPGLITWQSTNSLYEDDDSAIGYVLTFTVAMDRGEPEE